MEKTIIIVAGPTAVGKTSVAIQVAEALNTEIISADSRQCYREMNIGVARPSREELNSVPHHFIASHSIQDDVNAATFAEYALRTANKLFQNSDNVVLCGGTGLYIKAFTEGLDNIPAIDPLIRKELIASFKEKGISWLQERVAIEDPEFFAKGEVQNPHRIMRALEVVRGTGRSILDWHTAVITERNFRTVKIGLDLPRELLYDRINKRVDEMISQGLVEEVKGLYQFRMNKALQTVGYQELFEWMSGNSSYENAVEKIKQHSRNYAKRQLTWFRRDPEINWFSPYSIAEILDFIGLQLSA